MLVEFSVENFLSFKNRVTFSMVAGSIKEHEVNNTFKVNELKLLKSASIYGANASGKSNLIKALKFVKDFVLDSSNNSNITKSIPVQNFKLSTVTENKSSFFEVIFIIDNNLYRYNFEVTTDRVISENLYFTPTTKEAVLFSRELDKITIKPYFKKEGAGLEQRTRPNALFLSVAAQFNGQRSKKILEWFDNCEILSGFYDQDMQRTVEYIQNEDNRKRIIEFISKIDVSIQQISLDYLINLVRQKNPEKPKPVLFSTHKKYDNKNNFFEYTEFNFANSESDGTKKILALAGLILDGRLKSKILIVDELDARLHSYLSIYLIKLFNSGTSNTQRSQLIFTTHDVKLMNSSLFRRDQIWFTAKDQYESTDLYSLVEYKKGIRNDEVFEKNYMQGRYGAIPYINDIENSFV